MNTEPEDDVDETSGCMNPYCGFSDCQGSHEQCDDFTYDEHSKFMDGDSP